MPHCACGQGVNGQLGAALHFGDGFGVRQPFDQWHKAPFLPFIAKTDHRSLLCRDPSCEEKRRLIRPKHGRQHATPCQVAAVKAKTKLFLNFPKKAVQAGLIPFAPATRKIPTGGPWQAGMIVPQVSQNLIVQKKSDLGSDKTGRISH